MQLVHPLQSFRGAVISNTRSTQDFADDFLFVSHYSVCSHDFNSFSLTLFYLFFLCLSDVSTCSVTIESAGEEDEYMNSQLSFKPCSESTEQQ